MTDLKLPHLSNSFAAKLGDSKIAADVHKQNKPVDFKSSLPRRAWRLSSQAADFAKPA